MEEKYVRKTIIGMLLTVANVVCILKSASKEMLQNCQKLILKRDCILIFKSQKFKPNQNAYRETEARSAPLPPQLKE